MIHINKITSREHWLKNMRDGGYFVDENNGLYEEPSEYPCFEYAPRQDDLPHYLYRSDLETMQEMLQELRP